MKRLIWILIALYVYSESSGQQTQGKRGVAEKTDNYFKLSVYLPGCKNDDTLSVFIENFLHPYSAAAPNKEFTAAVSSDSFFHFNIPVNEEIGTFRIYSLQKSDKIKLLESNEKYEALGNPLFWRKGDDLTVNIKVLFNSNPRVTAFNLTGKGALKSIIKLKADSLRQINVKGFDIARASELLDQKISTQFTLLESVKNKLHPSEYNTLKTYLVYSACDVDYLVVSKIKKILKDSVAFKSNSVELGKMFQNYSAVRERYQVSRNYLLESGEYLSYLISERIGKLQTSYLICNGTNSVDSIYYTVKRNYTGRLRDNLITKYFQSHIKPNNFNLIYEDALRTVKTDDCLRELSDIKTAPGLKVKDFSLLDTFGNKVRLSDFKGKVVLIDVWFTGCLPCRVYYKDVLSRVEEKYFHSGDIVFISISLDKFREQWVKSIMSHKYTSPEVVNLYTNGNAEDDPFMRFYNINAAPTPILIDKEGQTVGFRSQQLFEYESLVKLIEEKRSS